MAAVGGGGGVPDPHQALSDAFKDNSTQASRFGACYRNLKLDSYDKTGKEGKLKEQVKNLWNAIRQANPKHSRDRDQVLETLISKIKDDQPEIYKQLATMLMQQREESRGRGLNL